LATFDYVNAGTDGTPRTATYSITPPGGMWSSSANGIYTVSLQANQVTDLAGNPVAAGTLGTFTVNAVPDKTAPKASLTAPNVTVVSGAAYTFTVTYTDNVEVSVATLDSSNLRVTGPKGFSQLAKLVSVSPGANGTPLTATYKITPPGWAGSTVNNGVYTVTMQAKQVKDTSGNPVKSGTLGTFIVDTAPPTASLTASNVTKTGASSYTFTITYADNIAINVSTIGKVNAPSNILVTGPGGYSQSATLVKVNSSSNGTPRSATYRITPPGGTWTTPDEGTYTIAIQSSQIADTAGNFVAPHALGTFDFDTVPPTASLTKSSIVVASNGASFTVVFSDNVELKASTIGNSNIQVTGPKGYKKLATLVSVSSTTNGTPRSATYRIASPGTAWTAADDGTYTITMLSKQVTDVAGNPVAPGTLGSFTVAVPQSVPRKGPLPAAAAALSPSAATGSRAVQPAQIEDLDSLTAAAVSAQRGVSAESAVERAKKTLFASVADWSSE
jgi:hypothetical protein